MADSGRPDTSSEAGRRSFIHILNAKLPRKRNIAQGLLRNEDGEVLLCELAYKSEWDLPGGVVDPKESPAACVVREISEELGVSLGIQGLLAVNWLPPWRGWDDAVLFLYDLGVVPRSFTDDLTLLPREIKAVHWVAPHELGDHVAPYTARMVEQLLDGDDTAYTMYFENSEVPGA
ncbi:NUDIX domain-containing protein [Knoellia sp. CPCC 206453]|uniref:NUDIX domain-containing protein n=1 Tax=Knoellia pratensis TaxID=3404796 RepID=UPI00361A11D7